MSSQIVDNKRIVKNTLLLYFRMMLMMFISLFTSRLVLKILGVEDYGIYNIVGGTVTMFSFVGSAMIAATQRFLNYYMGKKDKIGLKQVFNASLIIHFFIAFIIVAISETIGLWFLYNKLSIPDVRFDAAFWCFQISVLSTAFVIMSYPYNATIIAHEKMKAFAYVSLVEAVSKLLVVYLLNLQQTDKLVYYAFLMMLIQIGMTLLYIYYCKTHFEETKFQFKGISSRLYKDILSFSGWNFLGNLANVCLMQGTNILLNMFFGPTVNAAKGISVQVQNAVNSFCANFQTAQNPQIVKSYAANEIGEMHKLVFRSSRFSYYLVLLFSVPIIIKPEYILNLWLGTPPVYSAVFVRYTMFFILIQSLANPLFTSSLATGNVKKIMSYIATFFISIIPLCYVALKLGGSPVIVFQIQLLLYVIAHIMRVVIISKQICFEIKTYLAEVVIPIIYTTILAFILCYLLSLVLVETIFMFLIYVVFCFMLVTVIIITFGITANERNSIVNILKRRMYEK